MRVASTATYSVAFSTVFMSMGFGGRTFDLVTCSFAPISVSGYFVPSMRRYGVG